jgi:NADH-quinone oxidoreductase subunit M
MDFRLLSVVTFIPLVGALLVLLMPKAREEAIKIVALLVTLADLVVSIPLFFMYNPIAGQKETLWLSEKAVPWIGQFGINYSMAVDGISLLMVLLTTLLGPIVILSSWTYIQKRIKEYFFSILFLQMGMLGVFCATDLFLFYLFWEAMLIPMYLIIGVWGGPRRVYAALKFFIYTMVGSVLMLIAILYLYFNSGADALTFDYHTLLNVQLSIREQLLLFGAFALAFAIKVPMFPFHTWLPDAHVEAPTAGSVILAGVLLKMGTYGFLRFAMSIFPVAAYKATPIFMTLAVIGIIYGALLSLVQKDIKKLVAYSSVSHLGFVMLGLFSVTAIGVTGGVLQMVNHGLSTGALFLMVGILYERRHTRMIADYGGIAKTVPAFTVLFMIVTLSSIGLPGTNGFVGEFLILLGTFQVNKVMAALAATGVILAACYMLWMVQRVFFGKIDKPENENIQDLKLREWVYLLPIILFIFWIGVYPKPFLDKIEPSVKDFVEQYNAEVAQYKGAAPATPKFIVHTPEKALVPANKPNMMPKVMVPAPIAPAAVNSPAKGGE